MCMRKENHNSAGIGRKKAHDICFNTDDEKGDYPMNDAKYLELTCAAVIMTMIILMLALWSEYKIVKAGAIIFACFQGLDLVRVTKRYARKMEEEANSK